MATIVVVIFLEHDQEIVEAIEAKDLLEVADITKTVDIVWRL